MRMVDIATNPFGYHVHAGEVLKRYAADENQTLPAQYHIAGHHFYLDICVSYGSENGTLIWTWSERALNN